jgi:hypothetical protein
MQYMMKKIFAQCLQTLSTPAPGKKRLFLVAPIKISPFTMWIGGGKDSISQNVFFANKDLYFCLFVAV